MCLRLPPCPSAFALHACVRALQLQEFGVSSDTDMKKVSLVFGLDPELPMDRSEFGRFELELGPVQYFETASGATCDFGEPAIQQVRQSTEPRSP